MYNSLTFADRGIFINFLPYNYILNSTSINSMITLCNVIANFLAYKWGQKNKISLKTRQVSSSFRLRNRGQHTQNLAQE